MSGFVQLSVFLFFLPDSSIGNNRGCCMCAVYCHASEFIKERKTHSNMIRTKVTRLQLERVDASFEYIERASELERFIHLSFNRFKAVTGVVGRLTLVYSNINILVPFHLEDY